MSAQSQSQQIKQNFLNHPYTQQATKFVSGQVNALDAEVSVVPFSSGLQTTEFAGGCIMPQFRQLHDPRRTLETVPVSSRTDCRSSTGTPCSATSRLRPRSLRLTVSSPSVPRECCVMSRADIHIPIHILRSCRGASSASRAHSACSGTCRSTRTTADPPAGPSS
jgi:hypothetical protein